MKIGSKLQFEVPDQCPDNCPAKPESFYQGCSCMRCPVFCCEPGKTEEDKKHLPMIGPDDYRDD